MSTRIDIRKALPGDAPAACTLLRRSIEEGRRDDHRDNPEEGRADLRRIASRHNLIITGSSDYHGTGKPNRLGENLTQPEMFARLEELATGSAVIR